MGVDKDRWKSGSHVKYNLGVHIIFCPKYRRKVLINNVDSRLSVLINEIASDLEFEVISHEIMPDHVHLFIKYPPTLSIHYIVQQLKGRSSRILREEFRWLKSRLPTLWTRSYFSESVGIINEEIIKKYIENQKNA